MRERIITLPVPGPNGPLRILLQSATTGEIVPLMDALVGMAKKSEHAETDPLKWLTKYGQHARPLIERYIMAPIVSFDGPARGAVEWSHLHIQNRFALVNAIADCSRSASVRRACRALPAIFGRLYESAVTRPVERTGELAIALDMHERFNDARFNVERYDEKWSFLFLAGPSRPEARGNKLEALWTVLSQRAWRYADSPVKFLRVAVRCEARRIVADREMADRLWDVGEPLQVEDVGRCWRR